MRRFIRVDRLDILLFLSFVIVAGSWVTEMTAQPAARYLLPAAIVEHGTFELDAYAPVVGVDRVEANGHIYSDKAPGQPLLGVPVVALGEALGVPAASSFSTADSIEEWVEGNVGVWAQTFVFCVIPGALLLLLMRRHVRRYTDDRSAVVASLALTWGSMILLFSTYLYAHVLTAFMCFSAWHLLTSAWRTASVRAGVAGVIVGYAFLTEYPAFGVAFVLGLWVLRRQGFWSAVLYSMPTILAGATTLVWNRMVYGTTTNSYSAKVDSNTFFLNPPKLYNTFEIFLGHKGLVFTPIVLVAIVGLVLGLRDRRPDMAVPAGVCAFAYLLQAGWPNPWGGETANPRYMLIMLPFLAYPLATMTSRVSRFTFNTLAAVGVVSMGLAATTLELLPEGQSLITGSLRYLDQGQTSTTVFALAFGPAGWIIYLVASAGILRLLVRELRAPSDRLGHAPAEVLDLVS